MKTRVLDEHALTVDDDYVVAPIQVNVAHPSTSDISLIDQRLTRIPMYCDETL